MDKGRLRQIAVVGAYLAAGFLAGALLFFQATRIAQADRDLWTLP